MFKKLISLFFEEVEESPQDHGTAAEVSAESNGSSVKVPELLVSSGEIKDKFLHVLFEALEKNNLDGFDYLEFKHFLRSLKEMDMDEETKFKSAFATAKTMGASVEKIADSAGHYLEILESEKDRFNQAVTQRLDNGVNSRKAEVDAILAEIAKKREVIVKLEEEIDTLEASVSSVNAEIADTEQKIAKTNEDFIRTHSTLVEQIADDLRKIQTFLS